MQALRFESYGTPTVLMGKGSAVGVDVVGKASNSDVSENAASANLRAEVQRIRDGAVTDVFSTQSPARCSRSACEHCVPEVATL